MWAGSKSVQDRISGWWCRGDLLAVDFRRCSGVAHASSHDCVVYSSLAAGLAIGVVGDAGVRAVGQQEKLFVVMILILIFAEALGLYGLIVSLILSQQNVYCGA